LGKEPQRIGGRSILGKIFCPQVQGALQRGYIRSDNRQVVDRRENR
jgi:hypothetical protein